MNPADPELPDAARPPGGAVVPALEPQPAPAVKPRRRRWFWLLAVPARLMLLALLALLWVLGTETGLRAALALADDLAPGLLRVEQIQGRIVGDLRLSGLQIRLPDLHLSAEDLELRWQPWSLLSGTLRIESFSARDLRIATAPSPPDPEPLTLPNLLLPLGIEVEQALVEGLRIGELGADAPPPFVVDRIRLAAGLQRARLELRELAVNLPEPRLQARAQGLGELVGDYPLRIDLTWSLSLPQTGPEHEAAQLNGAGQVTGDLARLQIAHSVTGALALGLTAEVRGVLAAPAWDARIELHRVDLPAFDPALPPMDLHGTLASSGDLDQAAVKGQLEGRASGPAAAEMPGAVAARDGGHAGGAGATPGLAADLDLVWADASLRIRSLRLKEDSSGAFLGASGVLAPAAGQVDIQADWGGLRWPLTGVAQVEARRGKIRLNGTLDAYRYDLAAEVAGPEIPASALALSGTGTRKSSRIEDLGLDTLGGHVDGTGEVAWDPALRWDLKLTAKDLDPGRQWSEWPGRLGGHLISQGRMTAAGADLAAQLEGLKGELRGYPVAALAQVRVAGAQVEIDAFEAASGPSQVQVKGRIGAALDLRFAVDSPDLVTLLPEARGSVKAEGRVLGTSAAPQVQFKLAALGVRVADQGAASLNGQADVGLGAGGRFEIRLDGRDLAAGGLTWQTLELRGDGAMADHRLSLMLKGPTLSLDLKASGALKADNVYQGSLGSLEIASAQAGRWRLQKPAPVRVAQPKLTVGPLCLRDAKVSQVNQVSQSSKGRQGRKGTKGHKGGSDSQGGQGGGSSGGCLSFTQTTAGKWDADIDLDRLAFDLLAPLLPKDLGLLGSASLKGRFTADGPVLTGSATLNVPKGSLSLVVGRQIQRIDFSNTRLGIASGAQGLTAKLDLPLAGIGGANLDLTLADWRLDAPMRPDQPLAARAQARVADFRRLANLVPDVTGLAGSLDLDMGLTGTLAKPGVTGQARLAGGGFDVPTLGQEVRNFTLEADSVAADQVTYRGGLDLGRRRLEIQGDSTRRAEGWQTKWRVFGDRLKVADTRQYFGIISPDIVLEVDAAGIAISGEVRLPEARIRPRLIPVGTLSPSGDVVVGEPAAQSAPFPVRADLRVVLGDEVSIDAFGLRGLLRGDLRVIKAPGREPVGDGQVSIVEGSYRLSGGLGLMAAIGKPLTVEQGILVFAQTPLNNPGLLLTAQRDGGDITAGVRVVGTLKKPKLTFFSESDPDLSQSEITSYLVTGVPPRRDNSDDARALAVGTYIGPKLYMEYESNLGDAADKVKLRYELNNRIELQTETGSGQGADVFWKFEN